MTRASIALVSLASLVAAATVTGAALTRAEATDGALPNTSCATTAACLEGDNTSTGPGVKGTSTKGNGSVGTTKSKGTTSGTDHAGVLGQDLQTGGGTGNAGVSGTSTNGSGVNGTSTNGDGVVGTGHVGVFGQGNFGVEGLVTGNDQYATVGFAQGTNGYGIDGGGFGTGGAGVVGQSFDDAFLAMGISHTDNLFRANNTSLADVFVVHDSGDTYVGGNLSAAGDVIANGVGSFGSRSSTVDGVFGASSVEGVHGQNNTSGDAIFADGFGGYLFRGNNSQGSNVFIVDDGGNVYANTYNGGLAVTTLQRTSSGQTVKTYAPEYTQPTAEDDGEAQLVNGMARVSLDPAFASTIDRSNYMVMVTPEGMTRGVLCVTQRTPVGFLVEENMGGRSTVQFSYRIVAKPYGSTAPRLPLAIVPAHFDQPMPKRTREALPRVPAPTHHARPKMRTPALPQPAM